MENQDIYVFMGEVRAELRAIHALLETHQKDTIDELKSLNARVAVLEAWKANAMGYIAGAALVLVVLFTVISKFL
jgi:hypothetical protein